MLDFYTKNINQQIEENNNLDREYYNKINFNTSFKNFINDISFILVVFTIIILINLDKKTVGELVYIILLFNLVQTSVNSLFLSLTDISRYFNAIYKLKELKNYKSFHHRKSEENLVGDIIVDDVSISYNKRDYLNKNLSFVINEGDKVLITGENGTGKSTFAKILKKYYECYEGDIYIGNKNIKDLDYYLLNKNILLISQKETLFNDTIENNIKLNSNNNEKYEEIIKLTMVDEIINSKVLKDKYLIEEGSFNLSGGEKQRITLARALMRDFNYLILDEALSEIDNNKRSKIIKEINKKYKDKTIIYISHNEDINRLFNKKIKF